MTTIKYTVNPAWESEVRRLLAVAKASFPDKQASQSLMGYMRANNQNAITVLS